MKSSLQQAFLWQVFFLLKIFSVLKIFFQSQKRSFYIWLLFSVPVKKLWDFQKAFLLQNWCSSVFKVISSAYSDKSKLDMQFYSINWFKRQVRWFFERLFCFKSAVLVFIKQAYRLGLSPKRGMAKLIFSKIVEARNLTPAIVFLQATILFVGYPLPD